MGVLRYRIRHDDGLETGGIDAGNGRPREDAVGQNGVRFCGAGIHQSGKMTKFGEMTKFVAGVTLPW